jgi:hypothetical protein
MHQILHHIDLKYKLLLRDEFVVVMVKDTKDVGG